MRIVIDMQGAQTESRFRGIGRYTMAFAQAVVRNSGEHEIILALSGLFPDTIETIRTAFDGLLSQQNIRVWHTLGPVQECEVGNNIRREVAEVVREAFLASLQPDIIHICSLFEGFGDDAVTSIGRFDTTTPVSVTLYDLIPLLNASEYLAPNPPYAGYYQHKIEYLKQANQCLAISEFARKEGIAHLSISEDSCINVSTAIDAHFYPQSINDAHANTLYQKFGLTRPFVLYTGGSDQRKNLPRLIEAYAKLPKALRAKNQLLFAGKMGHDYIAHLKGCAQSAGLQADELVFTGYITDEELVQLYNLCQLYVFPSWHEGFGLPALEAMACGAPVIGANTSSLPEVIGLEAALFDPLDVESIATKMQYALEDDVFRDTLRENGLQRAKLFSWDETAKKALAAWKTVGSINLAKHKLLSRKPKLAFVSPLPPERSGISDYSAELLPALAAHYEIEVVVAQEHVDEQWVQQHCVIRDVAWFKAHAHEMDRVVYQIGNSPLHAYMLSLLAEIPGVVVLHDFYLSGLMSWLELVAGSNNAWSDELYQAHGYGAVRERCQDPELTKSYYPVNFHVLQYAQGLIVHSEYSKTLANNWYGKGFADDWAVIPLLRAPATPIHNESVRRELGLENTDFVICSFGFLDSTKLNHRLLKAWLASKLAGDKRCKLIFVGDNHGGEYGQKLLDAIRASGFSDRIRITGFASPETFRKYLATADLAVQLRTQSRGETSAAVLDCMNYALPLIVNANGSIAELDCDAVWMLSDEFEDTELIGALEVLWGNTDKRKALGVRGQQIVHSRHEPSICAASYTEAIERFYLQSKTALSHVVNSIAATVKPSSTDAELVQLAQSIAINLPLLKPAKRLFLDVTATCSNDLKTGIERVARAVLVALLESPPLDYRVEPVYLSDTGGQWHYRHACHYTFGLLGCPPIAFEDERVAPESSDILLTLDLSGDKLVHAAHASLFESYRNLGVGIYAMVFDILPIRMPEMFPRDADQAHMQWLKAVSTLDGAVCISKAVADDLAAWQVESGLCFKKRRPFNISWTHLGADVSNSVPSLGFPADAYKMLQQLRIRPSFLMVGTIEPRKGYLQTMEAFDKLWASGVDANLVIIGHEGWQSLPHEMRRDIPDTIDRLRSHSELNKRLFWLDGISDEYLEKLYGASTCLIAASYGEGFGLPLIEAAQHKIPIIARNIPVFREVAGDHAFYFDTKEPSELAVSIQNWLQLYKKNEHPSSNKMSWLTWKESAQQLLSIVTANK